MISQTDEELVARIGGADVAAFSELYDRHAGRVYALCRRILASEHDAEEVLQDAFVQAWQQAGRFAASRGSVSTWLLVMARSRAIDRLRLSRGQSPQAAGEPLSDQPTLDADPELEMANLERASRVRRQVEALPAAQRVTLELAFFEGLTHGEIAAAMRQPLGTVKTRLRLALVRLRDAFETGASSDSDREPAPFTVALSSYFVAPAAPLAALLAGVTVLVVDDDDDTRDLMRAVLESAGAEVATRSSANAALSYLGGSWPDVLLTDIRMPGQDGYTLAAAALRLAHERGQPLPVVAFTAYEGKSSREGDVSFAAHLLKPASPRRVLETVAALCGRRPLAP